MGKLAESQRERSRALASLRRRRRRLSTELAQLDRQLAKAGKPKGRTAPSAEELDHWLDELSAGLDHLPPLPDNFSRADLYDDTGSGNLS